RKGSRILACRGGGTAGGYWRLAGAARLSATVDRGLAGWYPRLRSRDGGSRPALLLLEWMMRQPLSAPGAKPSPGPNAIDKPARVFAAEQVKGEAQFRRGVRHRQVHAGAAVLGDACQQWRALRVEDIQPFLARRAVDDVDCRRLYRRVTQGAGVDLDA